MRRFLMAVALAASSLSVSACSGLEEITSAGSAGIADTTKADEQAMLAAENVYLAANNLAQFSFDLNVLNADQRAKVKAADNKAYSALLAVRAAYRAGNSKNLVAALNELNTFAEEILSVVRSR